jgi:hypothetical protein
MNPNIQESDITSIKELQESVNNTKWSRTKEKRRMELQKIFQV